MREPWPVSRHAGDTGRVSLDRAPQIDDPPIGIVEVLASTSMISRSRQKHSSRPGERLDVGADIPQRGPHQWGSAELTPEKREGRLESHTHMLVDRRSGQ